MVAIGYLGAVAGLFTGLRFVKELRHAGIVRN
jgi:energy-coupling factor transport system substrate-specific component